MSARNRLCSDNMVAPAAYSLLAEKAEKMQQLQLRMMLAARLATLEANLRELTGLEDALSRFAGEYFEAVGSYATTLAKLQESHTESQLHTVGVMLHEQLAQQRNARKKRLKTTYRSLARAFHPDTNTGCERAAQMMQKINAAYAASDVATLARLEIEHLHHSSSSDVLAEKMARCESLIGACAAERTSLEDSPLFALHERTLLARLAGEDFIGRVVLGLKEQIRRQQPIGANAQAA